MWSGLQCWNKARSTILGEFTQLVWRLVGEIAGLQTNLLNTIIKTLKKGKVSYYVSFNERNDRPLEVMKLIVGNILLDDTTVLLKDGRG